MDGQVGGEETGVVVMYCPACGVGVEDHAGGFMREYRCPECNRLGYFRHNPPVYPGGAGMAEPRPRVDVPAPAGVSGSAAGGGRGGLGRIAAGVALAGALGLGGYAAWHAGAGQREQRAAAQEEVRALQLEKAYQDRLVRVLQQTEQAARLQGLQELRAQLTGSGLAIEKTVTDQLLAALAQANAEKEAAHKEKEAREAFRLEEAKRAEEQLKELAASNERRQRELAEKEAQAAKTLALQAAVESREKQVAEKEKQQRDVEQRLQTIENKLTTQTSQLDVQSEVLRAQKEALDAAAQAQAKQQAQQQLPQPIIIVKEPVPVASTTYIVQETRPVVPVYINTWSWSWGPRPQPRPNPWHGPGPGPGPGPRPVPRPHH